MKSPLRKSAAASLAAALLAPVSLAPILLAPILLIGCANLVGPRLVDLPLSKLQAGMDRRFPMNNKILELFEVELTRPQLALMPDSGRVALTLDAAVAPPFMRQSWRGNMALSGRLYIDAARNAVLMAEPRVDRLSVDGADESRQRQLTRVAGVLLEQVVADMPVYTFRPEDLSYAGVQFVPTHITTNANGLVITVEPRK